MKINFTAYTLYTLEFASWRYTEHGSVFISKLCEVFKEYGKKECFTKLLTKVWRRIQNYVFLY